MKCILLSILVIGALLYACAPDEGTVAQAAKETPTPAPSAREVDLQERVDELEQKVELLATVLNDWVSVMPQWFEVVENVREEVYGRYAALPGYYSSTDSLCARISALEDQVALPGFHCPWDTVGSRIGDLEGRVGSLENEVFGFSW